MYIFCFPQHIPLGKSISSYPFCRNHSCAKSAEPFDLSGFSRQQSDCFNMSTKLEHIPTKLRKYGQYLYSTNTARASLFPQNLLQFTLSTAKSFLLKNINYIYSNSMSSLTFLLISTLV